MEREVILPTLWLDSKSELIQNDLHVLETCCEGTLHYLPKLLMIVLDLLSTPYLKLLSINLSPPLLFF